ncbi:YncE family protein [Flavitalea flava]
MEKVLKILAVLALLMLVIVYTINARERKFRDYFFLKKIRMLPDGGRPVLGSGVVNPDLTLLLVHLEREGEESDPPFASDKENQLYFTIIDGREIAVSDQATGENIAEIPFEERIGGILFDPETRLLYCCSDEGGLTILRQQSRTVYKILQRLSIPVGCTAFALDARSGGIYIYAEGYAYIFTQT